MKKSVRVLAVLMVTAMVAAGCMSHKMMMSDRSMMMSDGTMMMMNADGTSRAITSEEMNAHMDMMMKDPRFAGMVMDRMKSNSSMPAMSMEKCKSMMSSMSGGGMMMMNADGTSRAMTDSEMRTQLDMMMKNPQMSQMVMDRMMANCKGM